MTSLLDAAKHAATKPRKNDRYEFHPEDQKLVERVVATAATLDDTQKVLDDLVLQLKRITTHWRDAQCREGIHHATVEIPASAASVQLQYKNAYSALTVTSADALRGIVGEAYPRLFRTIGVLGVKKEVMASAAKLGRLLAILEKAFTPDEFASFFDYSEKLVVTDQYDMLRYSILSEEQNGQLLMAGVKQMVSLSVRK